MARKEGPEKEGKEMNSWKALVCVLAMLAAVPAAKVQAADGFSIFNLGIGGHRAE